MPLLILAAPLFLGACGSGSENTTPAPHQSRQVSAMRTLVPIPVVTTFSWLRRDSVNLTRTATAVSIADKAAMPFIVNVAPDSRLRFGDISIALDVDGVAGQAYRAYRAAFGRSPDVAGLSYWIAAMDAGMPLERVAHSFIESAEFKALSGAAPSNADLIHRFYWHVLRRDGEPAGVAYWTAMLDKKLVTAAQVLVAFSESAESGELTLPMTRLGIAYTEPGVFYHVPQAAWWPSYSSGEPAANGAEAKMRFNEQGAMGRAYAGNIASYGPDWNVDLYVMSAPHPRFLYEVVDVDTASAAQRLARLQEWGAKGYVYMSTAVFQAERLNPYDIFVKNTERNTTYDYRLDPGIFTYVTLNHHGEQGYAYRGHLYISGTRYALYVKDMRSDAQYEYVRADYKMFDSGLMEQLNVMGSRSFTYIGGIPDSDEVAALYERNTVQMATYSYTASPKVTSSAQAAAEAIRLRALQGEAYFGDEMSMNGPMSIYYRGGLITHRMAGLAFP